MQFGRAQYEEHSCEIILNLDQWFRICRLKLFLFLDGCGGNTVQQSEPLEQFW